MLLGYGLHRWSTELGSLVPPEPGVMTSALPLVLFRPQQALGSEQSENGRHHYACPLYQTSARTGMLSTTGQSTNFVLHVDLRIPASTEPADWVLQGVAALCSVSN